jgi:hypothetical protein
MHHQARNKSEADETNETGFDNVPSSSFGPDEAMRNTVLCSGCCKIDLHWVVLRINHASTMTINEMNERPTARE